MATPETKRDLFASAENDLKSNSGGHYLKERAAPRAIAKPVRQERSGRVGVKAAPVLAVASDAGGTEGASFLAAPAPTNFRS
jgi:hypothetical protein